MESWKQTIVQAVICVGLLCVIWGGYFFVKHYGADRALTVTQDDFSWMCQVDSLESDEEKVVLSGFAFELGKDATEGTFEIVLQDIESGKNYFPKMEYREREDVNAYFLCGYDYVNVGFAASFDKNKLNLTEQDYEVLLRVKGKKKAYQIGTYISGGEFVYANPSAFHGLDVAGTDLEDIVENGVLRVYRPDYGMYVYQYEDMFYWIAEPEYGFVNGDTYIQYHTETTQIANLPQYRLDNGWYYDDLGFVFSEYELVGGEYGKYRVAAKEIVDEYSLTKIWTGNYINKEWVWQQDFRMYYKFE